MSRRTSVQISTDTWSQLNSIRRLGESMDDIISRLIVDHIEYLKIIDSKSTRLSEAY